MPAALAAALYIAAALRPCMASWLAALCPKGLPKALFGLLLRPAALCRMPVPVHVLLLLHLSPASDAQHLTPSSMHSWKIITSFLHTSCHIRTDSGKYHGVIGLISENSSMEFLCGHCACQGRSWGTTCADVSAGGRCHALTERWGSLQAAWAVAAPGSSCGAARLGPPGAARGCT